MTNKNSTFGYTIEEIRLFKSLNTPAKIQDYLNTIPFNFEKNGETCMSPRGVIEKGTAHCMEGALFSSSVLEFHGEEPLIFDLRSSSRPFDFDHVVSVYKKFGCYGAISKTNHAVLRYREPVYRTLRELALSFFHEYFLDTGIKTLREYSRLLDARTFNHLNWRTSSSNLFEIPEHLNNIRHYSLLSPSQIKYLRKADAVEILAGKIVEFRK